ncbi:FecR family protein [Pedobacter xixiisoli]|uniref:FecR family protein n=1 Tax=Pedobacter xixiisoli TaxID=1476464 RepID=A0A286A8H5_9SPHI|nr:FecR family protein [Pedobacter xixiisoli]SOD18216.1 FecR family protein [Pedobacter xixiisoli]
MEDRSKEYWLELIYDALTGNITKDDADQLAAWSMQSVEHKVFYEEAVAFFEMMEFGQQLSDHEIEAAYKEFLDKKEVKSVPLYKRILPHISVAAALLLAFFIGLYVSELKSNTVVETVFAVDKGSKSKTILPDGTEVWLNSATKLIVNRNFGKKDRRIKLEGEAFFDVAHDNEKPFIVETSALDVKVHGTSFNLSCYPKEETRVALFKGSVELLSVNGKSVMMKPDDVIAYRAETGKFRVMNETLEKEYAWRDSKIIFRNEKFEQIASRLERLFDVDISVMNKDIMSKKFTGDFVQNEPLPEILGIMSKVGGFSFKIKGRQIVIY